LSALTGGTGGSVADERERLLDDLLHLASFEDRRHVRGVLDGSPNRNGEIRIGRRNRAERTDPVVSTTNSATTLPLVPDRNSPSG
jgi:hypothetical protein